MDDTNTVPSSISKSVQESLFFLTAYVLLLRKVQWVLLVPLASISNSNQWADDVCNMHGVMQAHGGNAWSSRIWRIWSNMECMLALHVCSM